MNQGTVSIKAFWDTANIYTSSTNNLVPGASGSGTLLIGNSGKSVVCTLLIMESTLDNSPTAGVKFDLEAKITSAPVFPS